MAELRRLCGLFGVHGPMLATVTVLIGGLLTPGYDPMSSTISRLAGPGVPAAFAVELAIVLVGVALIALAIGLYPASASATAEHRLATTIAMLGLTGAPLAFASSLRHRKDWVAYARVSFAFGAAEVAMLLVGLALLRTTFADWGAWERCFLAVPMGWMVLLSARLLSARKIEPMSVSY